MVVLAGPLVSSANLLLFSYEIFACFYYMYFHLHVHLYVLSSDKASRIPSTRTATDAATTKEKLDFIPTRIPRIPASDWLVFVAFVG